MTCGIEGLGRAAAYLQLAEELDACQAAQAMERFHGGDARGRAWSARPAQDVDDLWLWRLLNGWRRSGDGRGAAEQALPAVARVDSCVHGHKWEQGRRLALCRCDARLNATHLLVPCRTSNWIAALCTCAMLSKVCAQM